MFFVLSQQFSWLIMPLSQMIIIFVAAYFIRHKVWKKRIFLVGLGLFLVYTNPVSSLLALRTWEIPATPFTEIDQTYDIGIVLCGMTNMLAIPQDRPHFQSSVDRITDAIRLYQEGKISKILISGGSGYLLFPDLKESVRLRKFALQMGVGPADLIIEDKSNNTRENAINSAAIIGDQYPSAKLLLITSATHMRRALGCFKKAGLQTDVFSTDIQTTPFSWDFRLILPTDQALGTWTNLIREWVGYTVYWVVGYL